MPQSKKGRAHSKSAKATPQVYVKILTEGAKVPKQAHEEDAGFDLIALDDILIEGGEIETIPTGLAFEIPRGHYGQIKSRSSLALKGLSVDGGVIDRGFRGEVKVILCNRNKEGRIKISKGEKIAQIIFPRVLTAPLVEKKEDLSDTERGIFGFGSSGK